MIYKYAPPQYSVPMDVYERLFPLLTVKHGGKFIRVVATDLLTLETYWFTFNVKDVGASMWISPRKVN